MKFLEKKLNMEKIKRRPKRNLMNTAIYIAEKYYGGHYSIFSFTHSVSFCFGTLNSRDEIEGLEKYTDINDAITNEIQMFMCNNHNAFSVVNFMLKK